MDDVLIVGAGPVGLTVAGELCRHGIRCRIVDRLTQPLPYCRAIGVTPRTLEVWEDMGVVREIIDSGLWLTGGRSIIDGQQRDSFETFPELPYSPLGLPQYETERVLTEHLRRFGVEVEKGITVSTLTETADGVHVQFTHADGLSGNAMARFVVGCDGAHSAVRRALGIPFEGDSLPMSFMLGDVHIDWDLKRGMTFRALNLVENGAPDLFIAIPLPEPGRYRISMLTEPELQQPNTSSEHGIQSESRGPSLAHLQKVANRLIPGTPMLTDMRWSSIFRISMRLAARYRQNRVFIAGDAAHIHPPTGGQGMNTGIQDAYNLAWKLAVVLHGASPETLLDSYEAERRQVGAEVVARTTAATRNYGREPGQKPDRLADSQIRISYRSGDWVDDDGSFPADVPAAGDRAPDAGGLVRTGMGFPLRLFDILRGTAHVLIIHMADATVSAAPLIAFAARLRDWLDSHLRVVVITATEALPTGPGLVFFQDRQGSFVTVYGAGDASFLVRPDGYVGWRGNDWGSQGLITHLEKIFVRR